MMDFQMAGKAAVQGAEFAARTYLLLGKELFLSRKKFKVHSVGFIHDCKSQNSFFFFHSNRTFEFKLATWSPRT